MNPSGFLHPPAASLLSQKEEKQSTAEGRAQALLVLRAVAELQVGQRGSGHARRLPHHPPQATF